MALGCAAVTTFLFLKTWRLLTAPDAYFHRFNLKFTGRIRPAGWAFLIFAIAWLSLAAHSSWIRYNEYKGDQAFQRLIIPDELALAQLNPARWLRPADQESIASGSKHLGPAARFGLFTNETALGKLAWFKYLSGDAESATKMLAQAAAGQKDESKALSLYYRGAILSRAGKYNDAIASLDAALAERENLILARQEKGEALWLLGRKDEAMAIWSDALRRNPNLVLVNDQMAGALREAGRFSEATAYEEQADQATPDDPLYHGMLGIRLSNVGMRELAEKHFARASQLDPRSRPAPR
jgi:tetratricopeptide (TPR) repeat protein